MTLTRRTAPATPLLAPPSWVCAHAGWPRQSIRFVVPFAPGGTSEIVASTVATELSKQLGRTVDVENKGGGAGIPAMQDVAKSAPDGHTLILGHVASLAVNPCIFPNQPFDVNRDFMPMTLLAKVPTLFVIHPDVATRNYKEFVACVKKNPGRLNYGTAGNANAGHLAMEYLKLVEGMFITHIPYRGTGPMLADLLAGGTQASSAGLPALIPHIRAGKLRAIAVGTAQRMAQWPDVPTVAEMGHKDFETSQWYGIPVPTGTTVDIVKRLQEESCAAEGVEPDRQAGGHQAGLMFAGRPGGSGLGEVAHAGQAFELAVLRPQLGTMVARRGVDQAVGQGQAVDGGFQGQGRIDADDLAALHQRQCRCGHVVAHLTRQFLGDFVQGQCRHDQVLRLLDDCGVQVGPWGVGKEFQPARRIQRHRCSRCNRFGGPGRAPPRWCALRCGAHSVRSGSRCKRVSMPRAMPRSAEAGRSGIRRSPPLNSTTIRRVPGFRRNRSRTASGMTTWNLGDTVTVFMSIILSYDGSTIDRHRECSG